LLLCSVEEVSFPGLVEVESFPRSVEVVLSVLVEVVSFTGLVEGVSLLDSFEGLLDVFLSSKGIESVLVVVGSAS
jgi:hypothetical protein